MTSKQTPHWGNGTPKYDSKLCPQIAYELLSKEAFQPLTRVAVALQCSRQTIYDWRKKYPEFEEAVQKGLAVGEDKTYDVLIGMSKTPAALSNNKITCLLAAQIYGIREEAPQVIINNSNTLSPEKALKARGIPIPEIAVEDVEDECSECGACDEPDKAQCPANQG